jgi:hypothetical protein
MVQFSGSTPIVQLVWDWVVWINAIRNLVILFSEAVDQYTTKYPMCESSESCEPFEPAEFIRDPRLESEGVQACIDRVSEKLAGAIKDGLERGFDGIRDLNETVQALWMENKGALPGEFVAEVEKHFQTASEVFDAASEELDDVKEWVDQNPEKLEASIKLFLLLLVGFEDTTVLVDYLGKNPEVLGKIFESLA